MSILPDQPLECVATCRPGLEGVLAEEIASLGGKLDAKSGKRAVYFTHDLRGIYRLNMAVRTAIQILIPIRTFNARNYDMLYYQSRKTNWHQYFTNAETLRIDVNGQSSTLNNTQYVVHRVKDGIVDTFRKLSGGIRPSINKDAPDVHIIVHLDGPRVTLCLDSSGLPLFKRGYRIKHGSAPMKEDLAAGMLLLANLQGKKGLIDPMCGAGTLVFEGWMILNGIAPNLNREFSFQHWLDFDENSFNEEKEALLSRQPAQPEAVCIGCDSDEQVIDLCREIQASHFPEANLQFENTPFQDFTGTFPGALMAANPPYGKRLGADEDLKELYYSMGAAAKRMVPDGELAFFTTNRQAARKVHMRADKTTTLFNGALEGSLYQYKIHNPRSTESAK